MKRNEDSGFVLVLIMCLFAMLIIFENHPAQEKPGVAKEKHISNKQPDIHVLTISYHMSLDTIYTGAITYFPYEGAKTFKLSEKSFSTYGVSALHEVMFKFQRISGEECKLFVNFGMKKGKNALIRCQDRVFVMDACILKKSDDKYMLIVAPSEAEVAAMQKLI